MDLDIELWLRLRDEFQSEGNNNAWLTKKNIGEEERTFGLAKN